MNRVIVVLTLAVSSWTWAQEIGTEISPVTPDSSTKPPVDPWAKPPPPPPPADPWAKPADPWGKPPSKKEEAKGTSSSSKAKDAASPAKGKDKDASGGASDNGTTVAAGSGSVGLRAGFSGGGAPGIPSSSAGAPAPTAAAPFFGLTFFAGDQVSLDVDLGFGMVLLSSSVLVSTGLGLGLNFHFRGPTAALHPYFNLGGGFGLVMAGSGDPVVAVHAQLGFGAEYFFSPHFSARGQVTVYAPMQFPNGNFLLGLFTFMPGAAATWYF